MFGIGAVPSLACMSSASVGVLYLRHQSTAMTQRHSPIRTGSATALRDVAPFLMCLVAILFVSAGAVAPAAAQTSNQRGQRYLDDAHTAYEAGRYADARDLANLAHRTSPSATALLASAYAQCQLGDRVACVSALRGCLAFDAQHGGDGALTPEERVQVQQVLTGYEATVGSYVLRVTPPGANVSIDGTRVTIEDGEALLLAPGLHTITVRAEGFAPYERPLNVQAGARSESVEIALVPTRGPTPIQPPTARADAAPVDETTSTAAIVRAEEPVDVQTPRVQLTDEESEAARLAARRNRRVGFAVMFPAIGVGAGLVGAGVTLTIDKKLEPEMGAILIGAGVVCAAGGAIFGIIRARRAGRTLRGLREEPAQAATMTPYLLPSRHGVSGGLLGRF